MTCPYGTYTMEGDQVVILHKFIEKELGTGWADSATDLQSKVCYFIYIILYLCKIKNI